MFSSLFRVLFVHENHTSVIEEKPERALNAVEEAIYDRVIDVLHVGLPLLRGRLSFEQRPIALRDVTECDTHNESPSLPHLKSPAEMKFKS